MAGGDRLPADVERLVELLVSPRVGVIEHLVRLHHGADAPSQFVMYQALLSHFEFRKSELPERAGIGKGATEAAAIRGAIGEAIEQYCACHIPPAAVVRAALVDLGHRALDPRDCVLYAPSQYARAGFPYHPFSPTTPIGWVAGQRLAPPGAVGGDGGVVAAPGLGGVGLPAETILVPASLVYMNYEPEVPAEQIVAVTSNGLAAGPELAFAVLRGLWEVVERDAFMLAWLNRLPLPHVDCSALTGLPRSIFAHFARAGIEVHVLNATTDIAVPVMVAIAVDRSGRGPAAVVGLGCDLNPTTAAQRALLELCQVYPGEAMRFRDSPPPGRPLDFDAVRDMADHSALFALPQMLPELRFLLDQPASQRVEDLANRATGRPQTDLATCLTLLDRAESQVVYVDLTTPDIASVGMHVVRVICTRLQPIHFGHGEARLGGSRVLTIARTLGLAGAVRTEADLNPCPHPLA